MEDAHTCTIAGFHKVTTRRAKQLYMKCGIRIVYKFITKSFLMYRIPKVLDKFALPWLCWRQG